MNIEDIFDLSNQKVPIKMPEMVAGFEPKISSAPLITPEKAKSILTGIAEFGANLGPGGGITDAAGLAANPFGEGKLPSFGENVLDTIAQFKQGNYVSGASKGLESALQALGTAGDTVQMAGIASGVGAIPALAIGAGMKLPLKTKRFLANLGSIKTIPAKGEYTSDFTNMVKSFQEERPDIYNRAIRMMNDNKLPEEAIVKMINSELNTLAKGAKVPEKQNLNFISPEEAFPKDQKLYLEAQGQDYGTVSLGTPNERAKLHLSRTSYNAQNYGDPDSQFVRERPIHFNSTVIARQTLIDSPDGQLTGKEIYNQIKNAQIKDGGIKDKELVDTGLNQLKDSDDIFSLSSDQQTLINETNPQKLSTGALMNLSEEWQSKIKNLNIPLNKNKIVSRSNFMSDYGKPDPKDFDDVPFTGNELGGGIYVGNIPQMFQETQRIGGKELAGKESIDYGMITINDASGSSDFTAHISSDSPSALSGGNIAWSRVSVREHPNGKKYLVPEEFQSDLHTKAQGTQGRPGKGYKLTEHEQLRLDKDYSQKNEAYNIEEKNLINEISPSNELGTIYEQKIVDLKLENASDVPNEIKPNYSILGENSNDLIRLKELHEDAMLEVLGSNLDNLKAKNVLFNQMGYEGSKSNESFNALSEFVAYSIPNYEGTKALQKFPAVIKYQNAKQALIEKAGISGKLGEWEGMGGIPNPRDELDFNHKLARAMSEGVNANDQSFSKISSLHGEIADLLDPIGSTPSFDIYDNLWKTASDLKKDPEFQKIRRSNVSLEEKQEYIRNKFFENADPDGSLEIAEHIELGQGDRQLALIISDIDWLIRPNKFDDDVEGNIKYLKKLHSSSTDFKMDTSSEPVKKYIVAKMDKDRAFEKTTNISDIPYAPLPAQSEWTKVLMRDLMRVAADKGLDGVVLPNAQAYINAGGRGKYDWDPSVEKQNKLQKGYENTTIPAFKSVAKEMGVDVDTIKWEGWTENLNNTHLVIPVNKDLSGKSLRAYKEGGRVSLLDNINIFDLGESLYG